MNKIKINKYLVLLTVIFIVGTFFRFYKLGSIPPGPEWDEASVGYNAFSIAQTGKDEWETRFPLIFQAFGDYKNPLYIYLTAIFIKFFGLNIITIRLTNVLAGSLFILVIYLIGSKIFNKKIGLLAILFLALSPYGFFFSRISGDGIMLSSFLVATGVLMEINYLKSQRFLFFLLSIVFLMLSMFSYNLGRIVSPILLSIFFLINILNSQKLNKKLFLIPLLIILLAFYLIFKQSSLSLSSRMQYVGIFGANKGLALEIDEFRGHDKNNLKSRLLHNKLTFTGITLLGNYLSHFSTDFLLNYKDHGNVSESHTPLLFMILLPFYYTGILFGFKELFKKSPKEKRSQIFILLFVLLIAPLPSTITEGAPSSKRSLAMHGFIELFTAFGLVTTFSLLKHKLKSNKLIVFIIGVLFAINVGTFLYFFYWIYPKQYGYMYAVRENKICEVIKAKYQQYDQFIFSRRIDGVPYIFPLFCLQFPPEKYWQTRQSRFVDGWHYIDAFDKFQFVDVVDEKIFDKLAPNNKIALFTNEEEKKTILPLLIEKKLISPDQQLIMTKSLINNPKLPLYLFTFRL
ncbi:hypothetical protein AUK04_04305 [Candidatus Roizmanbacteria bacterium CG2_30_33_16]|uniref:Glycosyltransferase RgtA/B/C/D-like domain-containing protein n=4 Tax=Candidatus Roizmaniibacteriota TaxID=1752723 RepID=A0A1J5HBR1_9BACT|nr:MAG: hypothetical protein AUK04_04305 [Candidatus Roizmanbacteria bacterium CG2_30_33_16]